MARRAKVSADFAPMHLRVRRVTVNSVAVAEGRTVRRVAIGQSVVMANDGSGVDRDGRGPGPSADDPAERPGADPDQPV